MGLNITPSFSVIIPWCNRLETACTFQENLPIFRANKAEVIFVNSAGDIDLLYTLLDEGATTWLRVIDVFESTFNKSFAINVGVHCAAAEYIFLLDADIVLKKDFFNSAKELNDKGVAVSVDRVIDEADQDGLCGDHITDISFTISIKTAEKRNAEVCTKRLDFINGSRNGPGLVFLRRKDFIAVNGMNSYLQGWGWEDIDLLFRLQLELGIRTATLGEVLHLVQGHLKGNNLNRADTESLNRAFCIGRYSLGNFKGTYSEDICHWQEAISKNRLRSKLFDIRK